MLFTYKRSVTYLTVIAILLLAIFIQGIAPPKAMAAPLYSCGDLQNNHCYAVVGWSGLVNGADTRIGTRGITGGGCGVNTEMWLLDSTSTYWVEAGITAQINLNNNTPTLFWADNRPGGGFHNHFSGPLVSGDYGANALTRITLSGSNTYNISISAPITNFSGVSTNSFVNPDGIWIGMELCGSQGASVPPVGITNNRWLDGVGGWHYQTTDAPVISLNSPANGYWFARPSQSSTGGDWSVCIIGAGC
ncbi:MAG TPA: hypothetical protein VKY19_24425 [Ktedonosporobacter sp.]|jgi:hypothetical protein|nr:hypothetical protein [Ktedonosporobacter sp.]